MHHPQPRYQKSSTTTFPFKSASETALPSMSLADQSGDGLFLMPANSFDDSVAYFAYSAWLVIILSISAFTASDLADSLADVSIASAAAASFSASAAASSSPIFFE